MTGVSQGPDADVGAEMSPCVTCSIKLANTALLGGPLSRACLGKAAAEARVEVRDAIVSTFVTHVTKPVLGRQTLISATARVLQVARVCSESRAGKPAMARGPWCPRLQRPREGAHTHGNCGEGQGP